jgi:hypothetical protein
LEKQRLGILGIDGHGCLGSVERSHVVAAVVLDACQVDPGLDPLAVDLDGASHRIGRVIRAPGLPQRQSVHVVRPGPPGALLRLSAKVRRGHGEFPFGVGFPCHDEPVGIRVDGDAVRPVRLGT